MTDLHSDQASPSRAEAAFAFLGDLGFQLGERWVSEGGSFRDGWRLVYSAPTMTVTVQYLDMQLEVLFGRAGVEVDYLFIDRELFGRRSGLAGNMFPPQKVGEVIDRVASDIREHFNAILLGDESDWARIGRLLEAPKARARLP
jgi:hypothetical protein